MLAAVDGVMGQPDGTPAVLAPITGALIVCVFALSLNAVPAVNASPAYKAYAVKLVANLPAGARFRPDLEKALNRMAARARANAGRSTLRASNLLTTAARAQAVEMLRGNFVGHSSASGYRFAQRFAAFADPDVHGDRGENAARDRQKGAVNTAKARRLFQQWLDSAGHRRNLLNPAYHYVSTGAVQKGNHLYAVQIFWER